MRMLKGSCAGIEIQVVSKFGSHTDNAMRFGTFEEKFVNKNFLVKMPCKTLKSVHAGSRTDHLLDGSFPRLF